MSEYIEIETEESDDGNVMHFYTNLKLAEEGVETYDSVTAMEEGSAIAQALSVIEGILYLRIEEGEMSITRDAMTPWHAIVGDVSAILKDFFL